MINRPTDHTAMWPDDWDRNSPNFLLKITNFFTKLVFYTFFQKNHHFGHQHLFNLRRGILIAFSKLIETTLREISTLGMGL